MCIRRKERWGEGQENVRERKLGSCAMPPHTLCCLCGAGAANGSDDDLVSVPLTLRSQSLPAIAYMLPAPCALMVHLQCELDVWFRQESARGI